MKLVIRAYDDAHDRGFVLSTWFKSYEHVWRREHKQGRRAFNALVPTLVERIIAEPGTRCVVACWDDAPTRLRGWACGDSEGNLHWAYVPPALRNNGIARMCVVRISKQASPVMVVSHALPWQDARLKSEPSLLAKFITPQGAVEEAMA